MTDWKRIYQQVMLDFKGKKLIPHLAILGGGIVLGILLALYKDGNLSLMLLVWIAAALIDYLVYGKEILELFTKDKPYVLVGTIQNKVKKRVIEHKEEIDEYWFDIDVREAYALGRYSKSEEHYHQKEGLHGIQVRESMFLSLERGAEISLICEPDDFAWGVVNGDTVIKIES